MTSGVRAWLSALLRGFGDRLVPVTAEVCEEWGRLNVPDPLPVIDGLMAATAKVRGWTLVTRNVAGLARTDVRMLNPFGSFWTIDEGWDYFWPNPDGTEFIEGTGTHFWVHDRQRKFRTYGTWHLLLGPEGLLYEKYFRDRTSVWDGTVADIDRKLCQFLAPRAS